MTSDSSSKPRLLDWLGTGSFIIFFVLLLLGYDPIMRLGRLLFGKPAVEWLALRLQSWLTRSLYLKGASFDVEISDKVVPGQHYVLISNHQSMFDIVMMGHFMRSHNPKYVSKLENAVWYPSVAYHLRHGGNALIDRGSGREAIRVIRDYGKMSQEEGSSPSIYPEGTRSRDGQLKEFQAAGAVTLIKAANQLEVVPVTIDNSWQLMKFKFFPIPWGLTLRFRMGDPIPRTHAPREILALAREDIDATLNRWRENA